MSACVCERERCFLYYTCHQLQSLSHVKFTNLCTNEVIECDQLQNLGNQLHLVLVQDMIGLDVRFLKLFFPLAIQFVFQH